MEFNQLQLTKKNSEVNITFEGQIIAVKQYLPLMEKYYLAQGIINSCVEEDGKVVNYFKKDIAYVYDIINAYTDLDLTSADTLEETADRYDTVINSGLFDAIVEVIPEKELNIINTYIENGIMELQKYKSSPMMVLSDISNTVNNLMQDLSKITPDQLEQITQTMSSLQSQEEQVEETTEEVQEPENIEEK